MDLNMNIKKSIGNSINRKNIRSRTFNFNLLLYETKLYVLSIFFFYIIFIEWIILCIYFQWMDEISKKGLQFGEMTWLSVDQYIWATLLLIIDNPLLIMVHLSSERHLSENSSYSWTIHLESDWFLFFEQQWNLSNSGTLASTFVWGIDRHSVYTG